MANVDAFWFVWNPDARAPRRQHTSRAQAEQEAERLARAHPGERFVVLQSVCERRVESMQRIEHVAYTDDEVPF